MSINMAELQQMLTAPATQAPWKHVQKCTYFKQWVVSSRVHVHITSLFP